MSEAGDPFEPRDVGPPATPSGATTTEPVELVPPKASESDWPAQATSTSVDLVDQVRAKTTGPAITVARGLVFGLVVAVLGVVALVLLLVFAVRLTTEVLELLWDGSGVWLTYLIYGVVLVVVGAIVFGKRHVRGLG
jgi:uncharacterized integral membrane protein